MKQLLFYCYVLLLASACQPLVNLDEDEENLSILQIGNVPFEELTIYNDGAVYLYSVNDGIEDNTIEDLDLNGDGIIDYRIGYTGTEYDENGNYIYGSGEGYIISYNDNLAFGELVQPSSECYNFGERSNVIAFPENAVVNGSILQSGSWINGYLGFKLSCGDILIDEFQYDEFIHSAGQKNIGIKFKIGSEYHFGWISITMGNPANYEILYGVYNTIPNQGVRIDNISLFD